VSPELRLECLKLAVAMRDLGTRPEQVVERARLLEAYANGIEPPVGVISKVGHPRKRSN